MAQQWMDRSLVIMKLPIETKLTCWQDSVTENNPSLNVKKTKEIIVNCRRRKANPQPLIINGEEVEMGSSFKFPWIMLSEDLKWERNTTAIVKKAQQRLYFLRTLQRNNLSPELLESFNHCCPASVITYCITAWPVACTGKDRKSLSWVVRSALRIIGLLLRPLDGILKASTVHAAFCRVRFILQTIFAPSGRHYQAISARTARLLNSFICRDLNNHITLL